MSDQPVVVVGRIGKPFGVAGDVYVHTDPDLAEPLAVGAVCLTNVGTELVVVSSRDHKGRVVAAFDGVVGREAAEELRGVVLTRPRSEIVLDEETIWVSDLIGRQVVDEQGDLIGVVEQVRDGHAHDYLLLARPDGGTAMVPMVEELLDWSADPVVVRPIPGLLDPDEAL